MNKRPTSVIIVGCIFLATGILGSASHATHLKGPGQYDALWALLISLVGIVCGVYLLRRSNWARWLAVAWLAFHVIISPHPWQAFLVHSALLAVFVYLLFRPAATAYFRAASSGDVRRASRSSQPSWPGGAGRYAQKAAAVCWMNRQRVIGAIANSLLFVGRVQTELLGNQSAAAVGHFPAHNGQERFGFRNFLRLNLENILRKNCQISEFSCLQGPSLLFRELRVCRCSR